MICSISLVFVISLVSCSIATVLENVDATNNIISSSRAINGMVPMPQTKNWFSNQHIHNLRSSFLNRFVINHADYWCGYNYFDSHNCRAPCPSGDPASCPSGMTCFAGIFECVNKIHSPPPSPLSSTSTSGSSVMGYYQQSWLNSSIATNDKSFSGSNLGVAFSGWSNMEKSLDKASAWYSKLIGSKYISFGGGNWKGYITAAAIDSLNKYIQDGKLSGYEGICYDIEAGDSGLSSKLEQSFALAKQNGFKVLVTVSRSGPYGIADVNDIMNTLFNSQNIDYLSPQLYGDGSKPEYIPSWNYAWENWVNNKVPVVTTIVSGEYYNDAVQHLSQYGIKPVGWIKWI